MLLKLDNIEKSFSEKLLFEKISYEFPHTGFFILLGPSGCGKTTLFYLLLGLEQKDKGHIYYKGKELITAEDFRIFRSHCGVVFQEYGVLNYLSGEENLLLGGGNFLPQKLFSKKKLKMKTGNLSGGEKQRLSILRSLQQDPDILFCDEPTGALDEKNGNIVMKMLKEESQKRLIIMVSHNLSLAEKYGDVLLKIDEKHLLETRKNRILEKSSIEKRQTEFHFLKSLFVSFSSFSAEKIKLFFTLFAFVLSLTSVFLMISLKNSAPIAIQSEARTIADCKRMKVTEIEKKSIEGTHFSLSKMQRPSKDFLSSELNDFANIKVNFDSFLSDAIIENNGKNQKFLIKTFPYGSTLNDIRVNTLAKDILSESDVSITLHKKIETIIADKTIYDEVNLSIEAPISYVYEEFDFLNFPVIYLSSDALEEFMNETILKKASESLGRNLSLYERYDTYGIEDDPLKSYSYYVDVKEQKNIEKVKEKIVSITLDQGHSYDIESRYFIVTEALLSSTQLLEMVMQIFSLLSLLITFFLLHLFLMSNYQLRKKEFALYLTMGIKKERMFFSFFFPMLFFSILAFFVSFVPFEIGTKILGKQLFSYFGCNIFAYTSFSNEEIFFFLCFLSFLSFFLSLYPFRQIQKLKVGEVIRSE